MVFFVCEGCNETVKKNQVDKHVAKCKNCYAVTCVDCQVSFYGDDYALHISCISEAEKYEKSLYKSPKIKLNPQDAWMALVAEAIAEADKSTLTPSLKQNLKRLSELTNIPRNEKKFGNFIRNSLRLFNEGQITQLWQHLDRYKQKVSCTQTSTHNDVGDSSPTLLATAKVHSHDTDDNIEEATEAKLKKKKKTKKRNVESNEIEKDDPSETNADQEQNIETEPGKLKTEAADSSDNRKKRKKKESGKNCT